MVWKIGRAVFRHCTVWTYRIALSALLLAALITGGTALALQYWLLPAIDNYREPIVRTLSETVGQKVLVGRIHGAWQDYRPQLVLDDVAVVDQHGQTALKLARVSSVVSWSGLLTGHLRFHSLQIQQPALLVRRNANGNVSIAGMPVNPEAEGGGFARWILDQDEILVQDAQITWMDEQTAQPPLELNQVQVRLENSGPRHHLTVQGVPPVDLAAAVKLEVFVSAEQGEAPERWSGRGSLSLPYADVARWQGWFPLPFQVSRGAGSLNLTFSFDQMVVTNVAADLALVDVTMRLGSDLPELGMTFLKGSLGWRQEAGVTAVSARGLTLRTTDGIDLPPLEFEARRISADGSGTERTDLRFSGVTLGPIVKLADRFPIDAGLRRRLSEMAPDGFISRGQLAWDGDWETTPTYILRAVFDSATVKPIGLLPGFSGATGSIDASSVGGKLSLATKGAKLEMPKVFVEPLPLDTLNAQVDWSISNGETAIRLRNFAFSNAHVTGVVSGTYRSLKKSPGYADLTGRITRGDGREVWRYLPLAMRDTRAWLKRAILAGSSSDTRFRVHGNLDDFPFPDDKNGIFEVMVKVEGGSIRVAEGWPELNAAEGDLLFRGQRMELRGREASVLGVKLRRVNASIADLTVAEPRMSIQGEAEGPIEAFLAFLANSPMSERLGHVLDGIRAIGAASLSMGLDIPLTKIENTKLHGTLVLTRNRIEIAPKLPPIENASGSVAFSEHDVSLSNVTAVLFGHPLSVRSVTAKGGGLTLEATGRVDMQQVQQLYASPWLQFASGSARWRASLNVNRENPLIRVESDLVGVAISLPEPFTKSAASPVPLRVDRRAKGPQQTLLSVNYGTAMSAQVLSGPGDDAARIEVALGGVAPTLSRDGVWITGRIGHLDVDAWRGALAKLQLGRKDATAEALGVDMQLGAVTMSGRRFRETKVTGSQQSGRWQLKLVGQDAAGDVTWVSERGGALTGRFSTLMIPARTAQIEAASPTADDSLPTLDVQAQEFTLEGRNLGRLDLVAVPEGATSWRLNKLALSNADSTLSVTGQWSPGIRPETRVNLKLEVSDLGRFLSRLQLPEGVRGGKATLDGPLRWAGSPYRIDYPSLYGKLSLQANNGSFVKIEPGIAKLFGILSLQGIARELKHGDVFSKGYTFADIHANVDITQGVMDTQDFQMNGAAAKVGIKGQVSLLEETQTLTVRVTPVIGESVSLGAALLVNPAIGVGMLIGQKALKDPLDRLLSQEYLVRGTWSNPKIEPTVHGSKNPGDRPSR